MEQKIVEAIGQNNVETLTRVADMAASFTPGVSAVKDVYEAATGNNVLTGERLSAMERSIAVLGVLTLGTSSSLIHGTEALSRAAHEVQEGHAIEQVVASSTRTAEEAGRAAGEARQLGR
ncbi:MAG TPA: pre-toxin TG domain-containing protein, partial [Acetobacteraceae bacterium]